MYLGDYMLITSVSNERVKKWLKLRNRKHREKTKLYMIEGLHLVLEAYKKGYIEELILEQNEVLPIDVPTVYVTNEIINKISLLETSQNVMAVCRMKEESINIGTKLLILDSVQDPGNLGMIIRSAVAFNIDTIVLGNNTVDIYNPKALRATQGMLFHTNIIHRDLINFIVELKIKGIRIYGTKVTHGMNVKELNINDNYALIIGNEGSGVSEEVLELCDDYLYVNMNPLCESLNVSVATSIILYQFSK